MRLPKLITAAAILMLNACASAIVVGNQPIEDGTTVVPLYACPDNAVWDNGKRLIDVGLTDKLELKGDQFERLRQLWEQAGGEPKNPDSIFLFKHPNGDITLIIVVFARCVVGEETVLTEALLALLAGRQPTRPHGT